MIQKYFNLESSPILQVIESLENKLVIDSLNNFSHKLAHIFGSSKSGKTTLAILYSQKNNILVINNEEELKFDKNIDKYFIDSNILKFNQEKFFHFIQNILTYKYSVYIFSNHNVDISKFSLGDLKSRLSLFTKLTIYEPGEDLMMLLLRKYLMQKTIKIDDSIIIEIPKFIERSYLSVFNCANDINNLLYRNNHNINLKLIKEFYNAI